MVSTIYFVVFWFGGALALGMLGMKYGLAWLGILAFAHVWQWLKWQCIDEYEPREDWALTDDGRLVHRTTDREAWEKAHEAEYGEIIRHRERREERRHEALLDSYDWNLDQLANGIDTWVQQWVVSDLRPAGTDKVTKEQAKELLAKLRRDRASKKMRNDNDTQR